MTNSSEMGKVTPGYARMHEKMGEPKHINLDNFRSEDSGFNFTVWPASSHGVKYQKTMLYNSLDSSDREDISLYKRILNRHLGRPMTIKYFGEDVCIDYFQAVQEVKAISADIELENSHVMEIGAGFGRTCHALLSLFDNVSTYHIVDLKPCLDLSKRYLQNTLSKNLFDKVLFHEVNTLKDLEYINCDIVINVDGFGDMDEATVKSYLEYIDDKATFFYCKNPLGKYLEEPAAQDQPLNQAIKDALQIGLLQDIIDVYDSENLEDQIPKFLSCYSPGSDWSPISHGRALPWTFYYQAIYKKEKRVK